MRPVGVWSCLGIQDKDRTARHGPLSQFSPLLAQVLRRNDTITTPPHPTQSPMPEQATTGMVNDSEWLGPCFLRFNTMPSDGGALTMCPQCLAMSLPRPFQLELAPRLHSPPVRLSSHVELVAWVP